MRCAALLVSAALLNCFAAFAADVEQLPGAIRLPILPFDPMADCTLVKKLPVAKPPTAAKPKPRPPTVAKAAPAPARAASAPKPRPKHRAKPKAAAPDAYEYECPPLKGPPPLMSLLELPPGAAPPPAIAPPPDVPLPAELAPPAPCECFAETPPAYLLPPGFGPPPIYLLSPPAVLVATAAVPEPEMLALLAAGLLLLIWRRRTQWRSGL